MVQIASQPDPAASLRWAWSPEGTVLRGGDFGRCLPIGITDDDHWAHTPPDTHLLALGPPRSIAGKTASVIIPTILTARGPVVAASTKDDVIQATAIARAHKGQLWCYAPDGTTEVPPYVKALHWSPVVGAEDWGVALTTASEMVATLTSAELKSGDHWKDRASDLLAAVLHYAAKSGHDMRHARDAVYEFTAPAGDTTVGDVIRTWLKTHDAPDAASMLGSVLFAGREERAGIMSTAARALKGYRLPGAIDSTDNRNFDVEEFVRGGIAGRVDTVYIMSTRKQQEMVAPLVVALLGQIRDAVYKVHRERQCEDSVVFALDEMYGLAPLPDLPGMLSDGGSQGLLVAGGVQDLTLIKSRWPKEADAFLTLFGNVMVFPFIRDGHTLDAVSKLIGDHDAAKESTTVGGPRTTTTYSTHREPIFPPSQIYAGIDESTPDVCIVLHQLGAPGWAPLRSHPYWRMDPWPQVLIAYVLRALAGEPPDWRYDEAEVTGERPDVLDVLPLLPMPNLSAWINQWLNDRTSPWRGDWARKYAEIYPELCRRRGSGSAPRLATWEPDPS